MPGCPARKSARRAADAEAERLLQQRCREHVVHDHEGTGVVCQPADLREIDHLQHRIGRGFQQHELRRPAQRIAPLIEVGAVHEHALDAVARQQCRDDPVAGAEQRPRRHHTVAGAQVAEQCGMHRRHAACRHPARLRTLQQREALFQHRHGRIAEAGILVVRLGARESRLGLLGAVVDEAGSEEQCFGGLAEGAAFGAAMHEQGARTIGCGGRSGVVHARHPRRAEPTVDAGTVRQPTGAAVPGLFSALVSPRRNPAGQITRDGGGHRGASYGRALAPSTAAALYRDRSAGARV